MAKVKSLRLTIVIRQLTIDGIEDESVDEYALRYEKGEKNKKVESYVARELELKFFSDPLTYSKPIDVLHIGINKNHSLVIVTY